MRCTPLILTAAALALGSLAFGCMPAVTPAPELATSTPPAAPVWTLPDTSMAVRSVPPMAEWRTANDSLYYTAMMWSFASALHDTVVAAYVLDDDFVAQAADGTMRTKPALLHDMSTGVYPSASMSTRDLRIQHVGETGVVVSRIWWGVREAYPHTHAQYRVTDVFIRRPAGWRLASEQLALIQPLQIMPEDSADVAMAVNDLLNAAGQYGQGHAHIDMAQAPSAFSGELPDLLDGMKVPERAMSIIDLPRSAYFDMTEPPVITPFIPEHLRIQMLSQESALATFEIHHAGVAYRRTLVLRREAGRWRLEHVHASSVKMPTSPADIAVWCDTLPGRSTDRQSRVRAPIVPRPRSMPPRSGAIVGVVTERSTGRPLQDVSVIFDRLVTPPTARVPGEEVRTDSAGGFSATPEAGLYAVRTRMVSHRAAVDTITVQAGRADTLRFALRFLTCSGH
jgi:hypothetical protein